MSFCHGLKSEEEGPASIVVGRIAHVQVSPKYFLFFPLPRFSSHPISLFVCYKTRADTAMSLRQARQKS